MKVGLALGGGGAKGSYQLGVLKALIEHGILYDHIDAVAGTSIGAMNALMVTGRMSYEEMNEVWYDMSNKDVYNTQYLLIKQSKLFSLKSLYEMLKTKLSVERIYQSPIQGFATLTKVNGFNIGKQIDQRQMEKVVLNYNTSQEPHKISIASASVPLVFGATQIDGSYYIDGGLSDNFSVQPLIDAGCDIIIVVPLSTNKFDPTPYLDKATIINLGPIKPLAISYVASLNFNKELLDKRQSYGYELANQMLLYLKNEGFINKKNKFVIKDKQLFTFENMKNQIDQSFEVSLNDEIMKW